MRGIDISTSNGVYNTMLYPDIPEMDGDTYIITTLGDRLDKLALQYYGDVQWWYFIVIANPDKSIAGSIYLEPGVQLRIPIKESLTKFQYDTKNIN